MPRVDAAQCALGLIAGAFSEGMSLAEKSNLHLDTLLDVLSKGAMANGMFALKGPTMKDRNFPPAFPLKHQQKDLRLACELGCAHFHIPCESMC